MITFETDPFTAPTRARHEAHTNFERNLAALGKCRPVVRPPSGCGVEEWLFGRDGSLTGKDTQERWIGGSSLPHRVASELMRRLEINGVVAVLLTPSHAAQIRVALDRLSPQQAIVVIHPSQQTLAFHLHCDDFSREIASHRLHFVTGEDWADQLRELYLAHPGLPLPGQFIRLPILDAAELDPIISSAQRTFAEITRVRQQANVEWNPRRDGTRTIGVIAPSHFRLWNDKGQALLGVLRQLGDDIQIVHVDPDDPLQAAPSDLPSRFSHCHAVFAADLARVDLPHLLPERMLWITWLTAPRDLNCGPGDQVISASWPLAVKAHQSVNPEELAIICDTTPLDTPRDLEDFSSHRLLWETLRGELQANPFQISSDAMGWLKGRIKRLNLQQDAFPLARFVQQLVMPAYAQGVAAAVLDAKLPLKLYGNGWERIERFSVHCAGPIRTREDFDRVMARPHVLVHVWPGVENHPVESTGCNLIHASRAGREAFLIAAQTALAGRQSPAMPKQPALSPSLLSGILSAIPA